MRYFLLFGCDVEEYLLMFVRELKYLKVNDDAGETDFFKHLFECKKAV
jgi:hypothetical protein